MLFSPGSLAYRFKPTTTKIHLWSTISETEFDVNGLKRDALDYMEPFFVIAVNNIFLVDCYYILTRDHIGWLPLNKTTIISNYKTHEEFSNEAT